MKRWGSKLWLVLPVLLLVVSGIVAFSIIKSSGGKDKVQAISCTGEKSSDFSCWQQHYQAIVEDKSPEAAFVDFKSEYNTNAYVKSNCHQIGHVIGREAAKKYVTLSATYAHGDNFCWSGYYHGAIETIAARIGPKNIVSQLNNVCVELNKDGKYSFNYYNCVHGMGHGLMAVEGDNLFTALHGCDSYTGTWEQESCYGGVFMENVMDEINPGEHSNYLKSDDLLYPCDAANDRYKEQCYLMQTSHMLAKVNFDYQKVFDLCSSVATPYDATCYQSLGRDVSGQSSSDQALTVQRCMLGATEAAKENCFTGAVKDFISYFHSDQQGLAMCKAIPDDALASSCHDQAVEYYKSF